ncbi:MAG: acetyltransferase [Veillonellaceae bacterium]|nr:acetyltransferase [Veillonellaceae bacterium]
MNGLLIIGAGGHGKVIADIASALGQWESIAFLDDKYPELRQVLDWPVIGNIDNLGMYRRDFAAIFVAVGDNAIRKKLMKWAETEGFELPVLIHPRAAVSRFAVIGPGTIINNQAAVNANAKIGKGCIVNTGATVGHDCVMNDFVHVAPGASLAGETAIDDLCWIGMRSAVIEQVKLGVGVVIGAGAVVLENVPDHKLVVGVPAKIVKDLTFSD